MYLYTKDIYEPNDQFLINKRKKDPEAFIKYSNNIKDVYPNINNYNSNKN